MNSKQDKPKDTPESAPVRLPAFSKILLFAIVPLVVLVGAAVFADWYTTIPTSKAGNAYVGRQKCAECHQPELAKFTGSHHDLAMDKATDEFVLGDFDNATVEHYGVTSRMFRDGKKFMVNTEGPDGEMADFEVKYVFGVHPLQQYMVEFDREADLPENAIARLQVLRLSWDVDGKKWFYLSPPDVKEKLEPSDDLHWTGIAQNWNTMCAECHSTNLQKNYDPETQRYHTTYSEIDVSCEACHGPGGDHVKLAEAKSLFWDRKVGYGLPKLKSDDSHVEIQSCAPCHSRRRPIHPNFHPGEDFHDYFVNELINENTYHADGQILDEVYVYGSFVQSKMYHKGIRCTDCHDPHTATLKHDANKVCTSCHQHPEAKYDTFTHHQHEPGTSGASCVDCHMPESTYMQIDPRRDHSLRVPRPDLSAAVGTPNACTGCHLKDNELPKEITADLLQYNDWLLAARNENHPHNKEIKAELKRLDLWSKTATEKWYGPKEPSEVDRNFAVAVSEARRDNQDSVPLLEELASDRQAPSIERATALMELGRFPSEEPREVVKKLLQDKDPEVRMAALSHYEPRIPTSGEGGLPEEAIDFYVSELRPIFADLLPLLDDPVESVRQEVARVISRCPPNILGRLTTGPQREKYNKAVENLIAGLMLQNDRAGAHLSLGILYEQRDEYDKAIKSYRTAMAVQPGATGPRTNLAAIYDRRREVAEREMRDAAMKQNKEVARGHARTAAENAVKASELRAGELPLLARDAKYAPNNAQVQYRYALALYLAGNAEEAEAPMLRAAKQMPDASQYQVGMALLYQELKRFKDALPYAEKLVELTPGHVGNQKLLNQLRQEAKYLDGADKKEKEKTKVNEKDEESDRPE